MLSVQEARKRILANFRPVGTLLLPLEQGAGRVLAQDMTAEIDLPLFDNSSVDGFALKAADVAGAEPLSPRTLEVVADIPAGSNPAITLQSGQAARIMTGAALPAGADAVVMVEDTDFKTRDAGSPTPSQVAVLQPVPPNASVRRRGDDLHAGEIVLRGGQLLRAQEIGLLAMLGVARVAVYRRPRMALLSSGDELMEVGAPLMPGKVRDANSYALATLAEGSGAEITRLGVAADRPEDIRTRLDRAVASQVDVIVSSAGVSVGAFDYVKAVVEEQGELDFWQVNMRPGKPLAFGHYRGIPFFGLPGNPVSAFVGFLVYVRPALDRLSGKGESLSLHLTARLVEPIESDGRESYLRAMVFQENGELMVRLTGHQGSGNIFSMVQANALLIVPSGVKSLPANSDAEIWLIP
jgi:molybdopterin molybdotransferase